jgi:hypothetical protein
VAVTAERGGEELREAILGGLDPDQPRAHRDDVRVIMLAGEAGGEAVRDEGAAAGRVTVDRDRDADAGAAERDALVGRASAMAEARR